MPIDPPPSQPATPPSVLEYEREVYELKKAEFRARQQDEAAAARRAQALELAVRAEVPTVTGASIRTILETADVFLSYIEGGSTGERPA